jgi:hypothetical protein
MTHHLQLSYPLVIDVQELLDNILEKVAQYQPEHIAIGVLRNKTHVYMEVKNRIRKQGKSKRFLKFQYKDPTFKKNVKNYIPFMKKFDKNPEAVLHWRLNNNNQNQPQPLQIIIDDEESKTKMEQQQQQIEELKLSEEQQKKQIEELKIKNKQHRNEIKRQIARAKSFQKAFKDQKKLNEQLQQSLIQLAQNLPQKETTKKPRRRPSNSNKLREKRSKSSQSSTSKRKSRKNTNEQQDENPEKIEIDDDDVEKVKKKKKMDNKVLSEEKVNHQRNTESIRAKNKGSKKTFAELPQSEEEH